MSSAEQVTWLFEEERMHTGHWHGRVHHVFLKSKQRPTTDTHAQMSVNIEGVSAILQQSQAPNASQQSLHAAAQAFEQVSVTAMSCFRTQAVAPCPKLVEEVDRHAGA